MIKDKDETKSALPAFICKRDAEGTTARCIGKFNDEQVIATYQIAHKAKGIYYCKNVYVNFRNNICVVKIDRIGGEPVLADALALKEFAEANGFEKEYIPRSHSLKFTARRIEKEVK